MRRALLVESGTPLLPGSGIPCADALTVGSAVSLTLIMTLLGSAVPALRAARVDPIIALRSE